MGLKSVTHITGTSISEVEEIALRLLEKSETKLVKYL